MNRKEEFMDPVFPHCYFCGREINPYEEKVYVWSLFKDNKTLQAFLCTECDTERRALVNE